MPKIQRYHHSQNFLHSPQRIKELVAMSGIGHRDTVIEIGGGSGNITAVLAEICSEVIVIDIDPKWAKHLTHRFRNNSRVRVVKGDFLEFSLPEKIKYKILANPPFDQTAAVLQHILRAENPPEDCYLILQKEAAMKYTGQPFQPESLQSLLLKRRFEPRFLKRLARTDFLPAPSVDTVFWHLHTNTKKKEPECADFVCAVFQSKGETVKSRFQSVLSYPQIKRLGKACGFHPGQPIRQLGAEQWHAIFDWCYAHADITKLAGTKGSYQCLLSEQAGLLKRHRSHS